MTLRELLKDKVLPVTAYLKMWSGDLHPIKILAFGEAHAFVSELDGSFEDMHNLDADEWELYTEPKPKKKIYAYIKDSGGSVHRVIYSESERLSEVFESNSKYYRAPTLDVEVDE